MRMPQGITIRKLRQAIEEIYAYEERIAGGDDEAKRTLERLGQPGGLHELAAERANLDADEMEYMAAFPPRLIEAIRAVLHDVARSETKPMVELQFLPGYEFEVRFIEYGDQLTIHLRGPFASPFPRDAYRVAGK
jgi:hypothetical protein